MNNQHNPIQTNQIKINFLFTGFSAIFVVTVPDKPLFFHQEIFFFLLCICMAVRIRLTRILNKFFFRRIFACFIQNIQNVNEEWSIIMFFVRSGDCHECQSLNTVIFVYSIFFRERATQMALGGNNNRLRNNGQMDMHVFHNWLSFLSNKSILIIY